MEFVELFLQRAYTWFHQTIRDLLDFLLSLGDGFGEA
jgi:hypothetical protein